MVFNACLVNGCNLPRTQNSVKKKKLIKRAVECLRRVETPSNRVLFLANDKTACINSQGRKRCALRALQYSINIKNSAIPRIVANKNKMVPCKIGRAHV